MNKPIIAFAGMTHLGLVSAAAAAARGFPVVCFDVDAGLIERLSQGVLPVVEPDLPEILKKNRQGMTFTAAPEDLGPCDLMIVSPDVATDENGASDLSVLNSLLDTLEPYVREDGVQVILSQVPPGFSRKRKKPGRALYYQVETLIFGRAVERALAPERIIIGCADPATPLPASYRAFLEAFTCPLLPMGYESAELTKISINCCLVSSISVANTLAELCESIGADWAEIAPALKLDGRIGPKAYLTPGLGLAGGNLERDLATVIRLGDRENTDTSIIEAWTANSRHRKEWAYRMLEKYVFADNADPLIAILGLAYKENTHSTKNSPSLALLARLGGRRVRVYDPVVSSQVAEGVEGALSVDAAISGADVVVVMTPWDEFKAFNPGNLAVAMAGRTVIDPYRVFDPVAAVAANLHHITLGVSPELSEKAT